MGNKRSPALTSFTWPWYHLMHSKNTTPLWKCNGPVLPQDLENKNKVRLKKKKIGICILLNIFTVTTLVQPTLLSFLDYSKAFQLVSIVNFWLPEADLLWRKCIQPFHICVLVWFSPTLAMWLVLTLFKWGSCHRRKTFPGLLEDENTVSVSPRNSSLMWPISRIEL